jgi:hypothetical protein
MSNPDSQKVKDSPKDLKEIIAEFAQKNRTLFCICLAFSIWFYHGMFDWSTNFGARVKSSSETLFVVQVFLTAFTLSRMLVFINIIDKILRMPIICDLIFWLSWEDRRKINWCSENNVAYLDVILDLLENNNKFNDNNVLRDMYFNHRIGAAEDYRRSEDYSPSEYYDDSYASFEKRVIKSNILKIRNEFIIVPRSIHRYYTRKTKGFFYEEKWLPKLFPKLNKEWREKIGIILALLFYAFVITLSYFVHQWLSPTPIPVTTPEQLFFSYVNKHFL